MGSGGNNAGIKTDGDGSLRGCYLHGVRVAERAVPVYLRDLVFPHEVVHALHNVGGHFSAAGMGYPKIHADVIGHYPEFGGVVQHDVGDFRIFEKRFGGNTPHVEAHASPVFFLHDGDA